MCGDNIYFFHAYFSSPCILGSLDSWIFGFPYRWLDHSYFACLGGNHGLVAIDYR